MALIPPNKILFASKIPLGGQSLSGKSFGMQIFDKIGNAVRGAKGALVTANIGASANNASKTILKTGAAVGGGGFLASLGLSALAQPFKPFEQSLGLPQGSGMIAIIAVIAIIIILVVLKR